MSKPSYTPDEIAAAMALAHDPMTAAATDMYKALTLAEARMRETHDYGGTYEAIRTAIAKAEGRK